MSRVQKTRRPQRNSTNPSLVLQTSYDCHKPICHLLHRHRNTFVVRRISPLLPIGQGKARRDDQNDRTSTEEVQIPVAARREAGHLSSSVAAREESGIQPIEDVSPHPSSRTRQGSLSRVNLRRWLSSETSETDPAPRSARSQSSERTYRNCPYRLPTPECNHPKWRL